MASYEAEQRRITRERQGETRVKQRIQGKLAVIIAKVEKLRETEFNDLAWEQQDKLKAVIELLKNV